MVVSNLVFRALETHLGLVEDCENGTHRYMPDAQLIQEAEEAMSLDILRLIPRRAETFAIGADMMSLADYASESLPSSWVFRREIMLSQSGVAYFERPIKSPIDLEGEEFDRETWGLIWSVVKEAPAAKGTGFVYAIPLGGEIDHEGTEPLTLTVWLLDRLSREGHSYNLCRFLATSENEAIDPPAEDEERDFRFWFAMALFELLHQRIASVSNHEPPRAARRAVAHWRADAVVKVVTLRRRRPSREDSDEERDVDWSCRWMVGGHWREQWYPSEKLHRTIWVSPYVKGPEDKPLRVPRNKVFALVR